MNFKRTIAAAILLFPVVASSAVAGPASATDSQSERGDRTIVVESKGGYYKEHFHKHHHSRRIWIPGHWEFNRFGHRYWVPGRYEYRYFWN